jgi:hypothetical protein
MFGFGELEGEGMISDMKKSYNKNVKNTKLGKALKETAGTALGQVYDKGVVQIGNTRHLSGVADALKKGKQNNVSKLTQLSGLGLKLQGEGMTDARYRRPITMGNGMRMSGGMCSMCGAGNDKFLFSDQAL